METVFIILGGLAMLALIIIFLMKNDIIEDKDENLIPDKMEDIYEEAQSRLIEVKKEYQDVKSSLEDLKKQIKDIKNAAEGKKKRGRKPKK